MLDNLLLFALGMAMVAIDAVVTWLLVRDLRLGRASRQWSCTRGTVVEARIEELEGDSGPSYYPHVEFRYEVGGAIYHGKEWTHHTQDGTSESAEAVLNRFPIGQAVDVFFDPADPARAVLEQGVVVKPYVICFVAAIVLGIVGVVVMLKSAWTIAVSAGG